MFDITKMTTDDKYPMARGLVQSGISQTAPVDMPRIIWYH
jgi:hypothetical protein